VPGQAWQVQKARNAGFPGGPEGDRGEGSSGPVGGQIQQDVGVDQARPVFIKPDDGASVRSEQRSDPPKVVEDAGLVPIPCVKREGLPVPGFSSASIGTKVDDIQLVHRFRVESPERELLKSTRSV
jgi:hypothetical protein